MDGKRVQWIDEVKGVGILLMVIGHVYSDFIPNEFKVWIYGFHMPLFFIISGYSFGMFEEKKYSNWSIKDLIKKKAEAYLVPYLCFFCVNLVIQIAIEFLKGGGYKCSNTIYRSRAIFV